MMRLIDADALAERPISKSERNYRTYNLDDAYEDGYYDAMAEVRNAPSINIVRCGKCTHHKPSKIWAETKPCIVEPFPSIRCKILNREVNADDFCSYGEREDK